MKKIISLVIMVSVLITPMLSVNAYESEDIIGKTPNGTSVTYEDAMKIDAKINNAYKNMYVEKENYDFYKNSEGAFFSQQFDKAYSSEVKEFIFSDFDNISKFDNIKVISNTFYVTVDEYGVEVPLAKESFSDSAILEAGQYNMFLAVGSTLSGNNRKYTFIGKIMYNGNTNIEFSNSKSLAISWSGDESIVDYYSRAYYHNIGDTGTSSDTQAIVPNAGIAFKPYTSAGTSDFDPGRLYELQAYVYTEQNGRNYQLENVVLQYAYSWMTIVPSFSISSSPGLGFSIGVGSTAHTLSNVYET